MRRAFLEHLVSEGFIPSGEDECLRDLLRGAPEPIGSIAFSYGMITGADIDAILDRQRTSGSRFGDIAMELGMLTRAQVEALLYVQQMRAAAEIAEALALSGLCTIDEAIDHLGRFFSNNTVSPIHTEM
ncbi:MAG: hypothetical protein ACYS0G_07025 [Planctomycetota bacterium]|jgi:hypothetical protein